MFQLISTYIYVAIDTIFLLLNNAIYTNIK